MARKLAPDAQEAIATAKFIRISPTKARQVVDLIRGRHIDDARRVLAFNPRAATVPVAKVLESAVANAEHNRGLDADELTVVRTWVDEGPTLKRFRPRAMGRASRIRKRTCHISVVVGRHGYDDFIPVPVVAEIEEQPERPAPRKKTTSKKTTAKKSTSKRTTAKKSTAKKSTAKKATAKKTTAKKTTAKKPTAKKPTKKTEES